MLRTAHLLLVTRLTTCFITAPWNDALASERRNVTTEASQPRSSLAGSISGGVQVAREGVTNGLSAVHDADSSNGEIWGAALGLVPSESRLLMRASQSVASTNESKLLLGVIAGALVVTGVAMLAYGTTSSCKGSHPTDSTCDRFTVLGAVGLSGGTVMLVVWALSK